MYAVYGPCGYFRRIRKDKHGNQQVTHTKVFSLAKKYKTPTCARRMAQRLGAAYHVIDLDGGLYE